MARRFFFSLTLSRINSLEAEEFRLPSCRRLVYFIFDCHSQGGRFKARMYIHIHTRIYIHTLASMYVLTHKYMYIHMYTYIYVHLTQLPLPPDPLQCRRPHLCTCLHKHKTHKCENVYVHRHTHVRRLDPSRFFSCLFLKQKTRVHTHIYVYYNTHMYAYNEMT